MGSPHYYADYVFHMHDCMWSAACCVSLRQTEVPISSSSAAASGSQMVWPSSGQTEAVSQSVSLVGIQQAPQQTVTQTLPPTPPPSTLVACEASPISTISNITQTTPSPQSIIAPNPQQQQPRVAAAPPTRATPTRSAAAAQQQQQQQLQNHHHHHNHQHNPKKIQKSNSAVNNKKLRHREVEKNRHRQLQAMVKTLSEQIPGRIDKETQVQTMKRAARYCIYLRDVLNYHSQPMNRDKLERLYQKSCDNVDLMMDGRGSD